MTFRLLVRSLSASCRPKRITRHRVQVLLTSPPDSTCDPQLLSTILIGLSVSYFDFAAFWDPGFLSLFYDSRSLGRAEVPNGWISVGRIKATMADDSVDRGGETAGKGKGKGGPVIGIIGMGDVGGTSFASRLCLTCNRAMPTASSTSFSTHEH